MADYQDVQNNPMAYVLREADEFGLSEDAILILHDHAFQETIKVCAEDDPLHKEFLIATMQALVDDVLNLAYEIATTDFKTNRNASWSYYHGAFSMDYEGKPKRETINPTSKYVICNSVGHSISLVFLVEQHRGCRIMDSAIVIVDHIIKFMTWSSTTPTRSIYWLYLDGDKIWNEMLVTLKSTHIETDGIRHPINTTHSESSKTVFPQCAAVNFRLLGKTAQTMLLNRLGLKFSISVPQEMRDAVAKLSVPTPTVDQF